MREGGVKKVEGKGRKRGEKEETPGKREKDQEEGEVKKGWAKGSCEERE